MTAGEVIDLGQEALRVVLVLAGYPLSVALVVGLMVGMFQAATSINEATLSFIPKLAAVAVFINMAGPWMIEVATSFATELYLSIPSRIR